MAEEGGGSSLFGEIRRMVDRVGHAEWGRAVYYFEHYRKALLRGSNAFTANLASAHHG